MISKEKLLNRLPVFKNKWIKLHNEQSVHDIISEVLNSHYEFSSDYDLISDCFLKSSFKDIFDSLLKFCKKNFTYIEESENEQTVSSPGAMLSRGHVDCKGYSNFIAGIIDSINRNCNLSIKWNYRFASYNFTDSSPHHVFIVAYDNNGNEYWIDPTPGSENKEPYWFVDKKIKMALYKISGAIGGDEHTNSEPTTSETSGTSALSSMFSTFASGGDPTSAIIQFAASPQAGVLIKGITSNIKSLVEGIEDIFHRTQESPLVKVYKMFPIDTQYPNYVQLDAQINAIKNYVSLGCSEYIRCQTSTGDDQRSACEWVGAYNAIVANYGTLSTWLKVQEAITNYQSANGLGIPGLGNFNINPILIGAGAYLYFTSPKQNNKVAGSGSNLLIGTLLLGVFFFNKKQQQINLPVPDGEQNNQSNIYDSIDYKDGDSFI